MKVTALLLIAIVCVTSKNFRSVQGRTKVMTSLAQIDQSPIANMVLSQLQIHLASEGVVDDVVALVNELIAQTEAEQSAADAQHNQDVVTCDAEISGAANSRDSHAASQAQCEQTVVDTQGLLADAENELAETIANIAFLTQAIEDGTALRAQQAADYAVSQAKHQKAIDALTEAVRIIGNLQQGGSWIQLKSKVEKVTEEIKGLTHLAELDVYGPMVESLVELSSNNMSSNAVQEILDLLAKLRDHIQHTKDQETALENSRIAAWAQELATLTQQRNNAVSRKGTLETNIDNYHTIIANNQSAAAMHASESARFAELFDTWTAECANRQAAYDEGTSSRSADLEVLGRLQEYLAENVSTLEDYLMDRVNTF